MFGFFTVAVEVRCFFVRLKIFQKENANINSAHRKEKLHINVVVIGHVDSGKSTTTGHLIYKVCIHSQKKKKFHDTNQFSYDNSAVVLTSVPSRSSRRKPLSSERVLSSMPGFWTN